MFNKEIIKQHWEDNKSKFPITLAYMGNEKLDNIFEEIVNLISSLEYTPNEIKFTLLPEPDYGIWFSLKWNNFNLIIKQDMDTEDLLTELIVFIDGEEEMDKDIQSWEIIKNEIIRINKELILIKNPNH